MLQRFIGEDPLRFGSGDANLYAYAGNSPAVFRDPFGLQRYDKDKDKCLKDFYGSFGGKVIDFLSPGGYIWSPNALNNWEELATLSAGKYVGLKGLAAAANKFDTVEILTLFGKTTIPSSAGAGIEMGLKFLGKATVAASVAAGLIDIAVHRAWASYDPDYVPSE